MNLPDLSGPSGTVVFVDAMKQASPWVSSLRQPLHLAGDGNVRTLQRGEFAETLIYGNTLYPAGNYTLLYEGSGRFDIAPQSGAVVQRAPGHLVLRINGSRGGIHLYLRDVAGFDYPRNIRLILPGFERTYATQPFHPQFLNSLRQWRFNVLRFKNWMHGSTYAVSTVFQGRPTTDRFTQAGDAGMAAEYMIALANATGADPWFTMPVGATDLYIKNFALLVRQQLDPRLHPIFEYGDQVWKPGTLSNAYAIMAAGNVGLGSNPQSAEVNALRWYSLRSVQMFGLIRYMFGPQAPRVVRVLSGPLPVMRPQYAEIDRTILSNANAGRSADAFAVDTDGQALPLPVFGYAVNQAVSLAQGYKLSLFASQLSPVAQTLQGWRAAGGGMLVSDAVLGGSLAQLLSLQRYAAQYPAAHIQPGNLPFVASPPSPQEEGSRKPPSAARPIVALTPTPAPRLQGQFTPKPPTRTAAPLPVVRTPTPRPFLARPPTPVSPRIAVLTPSPGPLAVLGPAPAPGVAINAGGFAAGPYRTDSGFHGGVVLHSTSFGIDTKAVGNPAPQGVYQTARTGNFSYTFGGLRPNQRYIVRLHFAEYQYGAIGARTFNVSVNGKPALSRFDIYKVAGKRNTAVAVPLSATALSNGTITASFTGVSAPAIVQAIDVSAPSPLATKSPLQPALTSRSTLQPLADQNGFTLSCTPNPASDGPPPTGGSTCTGSDSNPIAIFTATTTDAANPNGPSACSQTYVTQTGTIFYTLSSSEDICTTYITDSSTQATSSPIQVTFSAVIASPSPTPTDTPTPVPTDTPTPVPTHTPTQDPADTRTP
ncbi:MAG: hypothetical protein GIW98_05770, partial [Candidatus Eremiobacteraeota bacterium]|nr:hypothetical protein [Candidatus Eremiobacteraeota bacterium]